MVLVVEGRLRIVASTAGGSESALGIRGPGSLVGELAAFDGRARTASAIALDELTVRVIAAEEFRLFITSRPGAAVQLIRMLIDRLREGDRRRVEFGAYDATGRVASLLHDLATEHASGDGGAVQVRPRLTSSPTPGSTRSSRAAGPVTDSRGARRPRHQEAT